MSDFLCRLCALECEKLVDIYQSENPNMQLDAKIATCLHIRVTKEDILPKTVCLTCCTKLNEFSVFLEKSIEAQTSLKKIYEIQPKTRKSKTIDRNVESPNDPQCGQAKSDDNGEIKIEELQIPEDSSSESDIQCSQFESTNESLETSVNQVTKLSTMVCPDDNDGDEVMNLIGSFKEKSCRRQKDPSINDVPANPRLTHFLEGYSWSCTICENKVVNTVQDLKDHYKSDHQQPPVFKCTYCGRQYERYRSFNRHIKMHLNPNRYACKICGKSFGSSSTLKAHDLVHTNEKPHVCKTCGKSYKCFAALYSHGKKHLPEEARKKFSCDVCKKELTTGHSLENHKKTHTGEKNFVCDVCGKAFAARSYLQNHLLNHNPNPNHVCSTCGKALKSAYLLGRHILLHTGIKPYQCDTCGKQFRERGNLREHSRVHTDEKPFSCEFCGKCFRYKGLLTGHLRQHTGERPYACLECRRYFTNWGNYNKHMKRIHHCDTSSRKNYRPSTDANNIQLDIADTETSEHIVSAEDKTNLYPSNPHDGSQERELSTEPALETDRS